MFFAKITKSYSMCNSFILSRQHDFNFNFKRDTAFKGGRGSVGKYCELKFTAQGRSNFKIFVKKGFEIFYF